MRYVYRIPTKGWINGKEDGVLFNINKINRAGVVVHCPKKKEAILFLQWASKYGFRWASGGSVGGKSLWFKYRSRTTYCLFLGQRGEISYYRDSPKKYTIYTLAELLLPGPSTTRWEALVANSA